MSQQTRNVDVVTLKCEKLIEIYGVDYSTKRKVRSGLRIGETHMDDHRGTHGKYLNKLE